MPNFYNILRARKFNTTADTALEIAPYGSATPNFSIDAGGKLRWSSGSAVADTTLYRSAADVLKTDDSFDVASGKTYKVDGTDVLSATTLGSSVIGSSLTSVGTLSTLSAATPSFTGPVTSTGVATFQNTLVLQQSMEKFATLGNITGTTNIDVLTSALYLCTPTGNFTLNIRGNSSTSLDTLMADNKSITIAIFASNTTARSLSAINIDGNSQNIKWFGGTAPSGNPSATDVYTISITKTISGVQYWTVYASQSKFA